MPLIVNMSVDFKNRPQNKSTPKKDLIGQKFGNWTVLEWIPKNGEKAGTWLCRCDCGIERALMSGFYHHNFICKCGINKKNAQSKDEIHINQKIRLLEAYKKRHETSGGIWTIDFSECVSLMDNPCYYCGIKNSNKIKISSVNSLEYNGIAMMNEDLGFVSGNVITKCKQCRYVNVELVNKKFGYLQVIEMVGQNEKGYILWRLVCDCGNEVIKPSVYITGSTFPSCGCYLTSDTYKKKASPTKDYEKRLTKTIYTNYKRRGKQSGKGFDLSMEDFSSMIQQDCFYCGAIPSNSISTRYRVHDNKSLSYNGLDRVDSGKGYTMDNVVTCCIRCNMGKLDYEQEEFYEWISNVYSNINTNNYNEISILHECGVYL
jgi:hypothetical protein